MSELSVNLQPATCVVSASTERSSRDISRNRPCRPPLKHWNLDGWYHAQLFHPMLLCQISEIEGLDSCSNLQCLSLGNNRISNLDSIIRLRRYPKLQLVNLEVQDRYFPNLLLVILRACHDRIVVFYPAAPRSPRLYHVAVEIYRSRRNKSTLLPNGSDRRQMSQNFGLPTKMKNTNSGKKRQHHRKGEVVSTAVATDRYVRQAGGPLGS